jgi:hypothetical protein
MGNLFSNLFDDSDVIQTAPSASYTITPSASSTTTTTSTTPSTSQTSSNSSPNGQCPEGTVNTSSTTTTTTTSSTANSPPAAVPFQGKSDSEFMDFLNDIFNATTYSILFWIVVMYIVYQFGTAIFANKGTSNETSGVSAYSRTIDIVLLLMIGIYCFQGYYYLDQNDKDNMVGYSLQWTETWLNDPWSLFGLIWFTIIFFLMVYLLKVPMDKDVKPVLVHLVEHKIWIFYATFAVIFFFKYILQIPIVTLLFNNGLVNYFKNVPPFSSDSPGIFEDIEEDLYGSSSSTQDVVLTSAPSPATCEAVDQVFNVSNNVYTYEEAQKVCAAFDASLATYDQIETSYKNGGEWCNYGWSEGQMAYFPTQKGTWEKLQNNPNTKHACGRPGINGGFIDNPYIKFGANCYGKKPPKPSGWEPSNYYEQCDVTNPEEEEMEKLRNKAKLNSFNNKKWSRY